MDIGNLIWTIEGGWRDSGAVAPDCQLVLWFAGPKALARVNPGEALTARFPAAQVVGCSTGGEILGEEVTDDTVVASCIRFASATATVRTAFDEHGDDSREAGRRLASRLDPAGLRAVFILADGMRTNGTAFIAGLREVLPEQVTVTGGLAGDGADFRRTLVGCGAVVKEGAIAAVGFYGDDLRVGWGSYGGWDRFGAEREITRSDRNVLYELDGEPALDLYRRYLGDEAANLPGSALLFPLAIRPPADEQAVLVRTIVGIDDQAKSLTFAGDVPQGHVAQFMRGHMEFLMDGASQAGQAAAEAAARCDGPVLALLVSCIGRKLLMGQRIVEEVEAAATSLGPQARPIGFYSYGELAPHGATGRCELHNQTMTITTIGEA